MAISPFDDRAPAHPFPVTATVGGSVVRIYTKSTGVSGKIHGAYWSDGDWHATAWFSTGHYRPVEDDGTQPECALDLIDSRS